MIVLATGSPYRAQILDAAGIPYVKILRPIDEDKLNTEIRHDGVSKHFCKQYVKMLALEKNRPFIADPIKDGAVITADTVVWCDGRILEKPITKEKCREQHNFVRNKKTYFITGYCVSYNGKVAQYVKSSTVIVGNVPPVIIDKICENPISLKIGGFQAEGEMKPYCKMKPKDRENWIGLCTVVLRKLLKKVGYHLK